MLNKAERLKIFKILRIFCIVGLLPTHVDLAKRELNVPSNSKRSISALSCGFFILHALYKNGSLVYVYFLVPNVQLHQLVIHAILAMGSAIYAFWYISSYVCNPGMFFAYVNITLKGHIAGHLDINDDLKKHWTRRMREYSLQDWIAIGMPYMIILALLIISGSFVHDPSMRLLMYAALPRRLQNRLTFGLCLLEEIRFLLVLVTIATPIWQLQVISFDTVCNQLRRIKQAIQNGTQSTKSAFTYLRCLQLYITLVNNVNSNLIFTWKLLSISVCIISGYAAVAHFQAYPVFGIMYYVILFDVMFIYTAIYEKAFKIPELFGEVGACALMGVRGSQRSLFRREILSIPPTGIKVGNFHKMERASTLIFIDFVLKNIVNLLVAYG